MFILLLIINRPWHESSLAASPAFERGSKGLEVADGLAEFGGGDTTGTKQHREEPG